MTDELDDLLSRAQIELPATLRERVEKAMAEAEHEQPIPVNETTAKRRLRETQQAQMQLRWMWAAAALLIMVIGGLLLLRVGGEDTVIIENIRSADILTGNNNTTRIPVEETPAFTETAEPTETATYPLNLITIPGEIVDATDEYLLFADGRLYNRQNGDFTELDVDETIRHPAMDETGTIIAYWGFDNKNGSECDDTVDNIQCGSFFIQGRESIVRIPFGVTEQFPLETVVSHEGRFIGFAAVGEQRTGAFVYDMLTETVRQLAAGGLALDMSASGQYVSVVTTNELTEEDINAAADVYLIDRLEATITLLSRSIDGVAGLTSDTEAFVSISQDGRFVAFPSTSSSLASVDYTPCELPTGEVASACQHVYVYNSDDESLALLSTMDDIPGDNVSTNPLISPDGRYIAYETQATNITACEDACTMVAVYDQETGQTRIVSASWDGRQTGVSSAVTWVDNQSLIILSDMDLLPDEAAMLDYYIVDVDAFFNQDSLMSGLR